MTAKKGKHFSPPYIMTFKEPSLCYFIGMNVICKAMISEVSDDRNQALGMAVMGVAWGTGSIIGPAIAGATADPIGQYNLNITSKHQNCHL